MTVVTLQKEKKHAEVSYQNWVSGSFTSSPQKLPKDVILTLGSTDGGVRVHGSAEKASTQKCGFEIGIKSIMLSFCGQGGRSGDEEEGGVGLGGGGGACISQTTAACQFLRHWNSALSQTRCGKSVKRTRDWGGAERGVGGRRAGGGGGAK